MAGPCPTRWPRCCARSAQRIGPRPFPANPGREGRLGSCLTNTRSVSESTASNHRSVRPSSKSGIARALSRLCWWRKAPNLPLNVWTCRSADAAGLALSLDVGRRHQAHPMTISEYLPFARWHPPSCMLILKIEQILFAGVGLDRSLRRRRTPLHASPAGASGR
jgi:hypothetical protein